MKNFFLTILLASVACSACDLIVKVDLPPHQPKLVVNALLQNHQSARVFVSHSIGILDSKDSSANYLHDARVNLLMDGSSLGWMAYHDTLLQLPNNREIKQGYYSLPHRPQPGHQYEVQVSHPQYASAKAVVEIPLVPKVSSIFFRQNALTGTTGNSISTLNISWDSLSQLSKYFELSAQASYVDTDPGNLVSRDLIFELLGNNRFLGQEGKLLFRQQSNSTSEVFFSLDHQGRGLQDDPKIEQLFWELRACDSIYFQLNIDFPRHQAASFSDFALFSGEPVVIKSNVEGGYGVVTAFSSLSDTIQ